MIHSFAQLGRAHWSCGFERLGKKKLNTAVLCCLHFYPSLLWIGAHPTQLTSAEDDAEQCRGRIRLGSPRRGGH